ncbi:hypothetical protein niasHT_008807 [Heterodera trifolii]|uniref:Uncharacterized protein n=1 Tax=Heterodera trifolii TaxID=157864 RepID=A0ABD2LSP1_9BILA
MCICATSARGRCAKNGCDWFLYLRQSVPLYILSWSAVSPTNSLPTETVPFGPDVNEVPELGHNRHDQVVEVVEDAVSAAYSSDHEFENCEEAINDYWQRYREGKEYRERKKEEKMKKTGQRKRKMAEMVSAAGENEQKEEQQEKNGAEKGLQQQPPVNADT